MRTTLIFIFGVATVLFLVAAARAPKESNEMRYLLLRKSVLSKYDHDHRGKLTGSETIAARKELERERALVLKKYDLNHDGKLDAKEKMAAREDILRKFSKVLKRYDTGGNGKLTPQEKTARKAELERIGSPSPKAAGRKA